MQKRPQALFIWLVCIAAAAAALAARKPELLAQIAEIKRFYGLREQRLEQLLAA